MSKNISSSDVSVSWEILKLYQEFQDYLNTKPGNEIPGILIDLEEKILALLEWREILTRRYKKNREQVERKILKIVTRESVDIESLLDQLSSRVQEILKKSPEEIDREMWIFVRELEWVILPPWEGNIREWDWKAEVREKRELLESRYGKVLEILRQNEIYVDDIIVYTWVLRDNQIRKTSYRVIQIPRLSKTIFVCDEYGESSFIAASLVYPEVFLEETKSDIREKLDVERVVHSKGWEERFTDVVFWKKDWENEDIKIPKKIDVRKMEEYRHEILRQFPTSADWMSLDKKQKHELKIQWKWLTAIARIFWISWKPRDNSRNMALLWQKIYGEWHDIIDCELWTVEQWRQDILRQFPSPEDWMKLTAIQKRELIIHWKWLSAIAWIFWISWNPTGYSQDMALLWQKIYGEWHDIIDCELWTVEDWKQNIQSKFSSPADWMSLDKKQKHELKIQWKWLTAIARIFWISWNPTGNSRNMALLWEKIYGNHKVFEEYLKEVVIKNWTQAQWKQEILKQFRTPEDWMSLKTKQKRELKIHWKWLMAIATIFWLSWNPVVNSRNMALLWEKIYWSHPVFDRYIKNKN